MPQNSSISEKIRQIREDRKLSISDLADISQVNAEMIKKIEQGKLAPSLSPLIKIARALGVRLGTFLDDHPDMGPVLIKAGKTDKIVRFSGDSTSSEKTELSFFSLASDKKDRHMEPFLIDVSPLEQDSPKLSTHEGEEFIFVLSGELEVNYGKEQYQLQQGDSIYYDSVVPHCVHAKKGTQAKILAVVYTPF